MHALIHVRILWGRVCEYELLYTAENSMGFYLFYWQYFLWQRVMNVYPIKKRNFHFSLKWVLYLGKAHGAKGINDMVVHVQW